MQRQSRLGYLHVFLFQCSISVEAPRRYSKQFISCFFTRFHLQNIRMAHRISSASSSQLTSTSALVSLLLVALLSLASLTQANPMVSGGGNGAVSSQEDDGGVGENSSKFSHILGRLSPPQVRVRERNDFVLMGWSLGHKVLGPIPHALLSYYALSRGTLSPDSLGSMPNCWCS